MRTFYIFLVAISFGDLGVRGFDLKCYEDHTDWEYVTCRKTCEVYDLEITAPENTVTSVNGQIEPTDFCILKIEAQTVNFIPKRLGEFFPLLQVLDISHSKLKVIKKYDLEMFPSLIRLNLPNNDLEVLSSELFKFNALLKKINFEFNKLLYVGENILEPLRDLQVANFEDNQCIKRDCNQYGMDDCKNDLREYCQPQTVKNLMSVNRGMRVALAEEKLNSEKLKLLESKLKSCNGNLESAAKNLLLTSKQLQSCIASDREFYVAAVQAEEIVLICENLEEEICNAVDLKVQKKISRIQQVKILEGESFQSNQIKAMMIFNQQTFFVPSQIAFWFPRLNELSVIESGLYAIDLTVLANLTSLTKLNLTNNKVQEIPSNAFNDLRSLEQLDLSFNHIDILEIDVFKSLLKLEVLNLSNNALTTISYETFEYLTNLKELLVGNNNLKYISANLLVPLTQIQYVDITNNVCINMSFPAEAMKLVEREIIDNCIAPIEVNCSYEAEVRGAENKTSNNDYTCRANGLNVNYQKTKLLTLDGDDSNIGVAVLKVIDQSTKFLPIQLATKFPNLEKLIVERSKLTSLQIHEFEGLLKLRTIEIRYNNISEIYEEAFDDVTELEHLDLSFNHIRSLPSKIFIRLVHLKTLILSNNQIEKLSADIFPRKNAIEEFRASNNLLEIIETKILRFLRKAKLIELTGNVCIDRKFDKSDNNLEGLLKLSGEIDLNCSADD